MKVSTVLLLLLPFMVAGQQGHYSEKRELSDFSYLLNKDKVFSDQIRWNGYFEAEGYAGHPKVAYWQQKDPKDTLVCAQPVFFFRNGIAAILTTSVYGMDVFHKIIANPANLEKYRSDFEWGTYEIAGDTIRAIFFHNYSEANSKLFSNFRATNYMGVIKSRDTIIGWKPAGPVKYKNGINELPLMLVFKPFDEKKFIDSSKAWVNKYRH